MTTNFSAEPQALGYLYQFLHALYLLLDIEHETKSLHVETLDDVVFEEQGTPTELLQLKHHVRQQASLSDFSPDLWKTLRVWSTRLLENEIRLPGVLLTLVTTAHAPDDSIAGLLGPTHRDVALARDRLLTTAKKSTNQSLSNAFNAFISIGPEQQHALVEAIQILDGSADILDTQRLIKGRLRVAVRRERLEAVYDRLQGWWFSKMIACLINQRTVPVTGFEVRNKIADICEQFGPEALPIDYLDVQPIDSVDPDRDSRMFVVQLREIGIKSRRIEKAILDYYRAFQQRTRWIREDLIIDDELSSYERRLVDEWERYCDMLQDESPISDDDDEKLRRRGVDIFNWVEGEADIRIRPNVAEPYVMRGTYHWLADKDSPQVWWHPRFLERLKELMALS